jgi:tRNA1(Val) A37 N6-methylase TrmN6
LDLTHGTLLDGRLLYAQPRDGYRTGLEPVLLAASVPAKPGDSVLEAGLGAGAGLLCLGARVAQLTCTGVEIDAAMAELATANLSANAAAGARVVTADILHWRCDAAFDHAFANPPWHNAAGTPSPVSGRAAAKRAAPGLLGGWALAVAGMLRPRGTLSLIVPAASLGETVAALTAAQCPEITLLPLWPHAGEAAKMLILRGVRRGRGACVVRPGLVLHETDGTFTAAAQAVLRGGLGLI